MEFVRCWTGRKWFIIGKWLAIGVMGWKVQRVMFMGKWIYMHGMHKEGLKMLNKQYEDA